MSLACACLLFSFVLVDIVLLRLLAPAVDWGPLWAAGRIGWIDPVRIYDFDLVTAAQTSLVEPTSLRPYVYPPSALLLFAPLSLLGFWISFTLFVAGSCALLAGTARSAGANVLLLLLAPPVVLAGLAGQPTLLVAALAVAGCLSLRRNEAGAGAMLGIAAMLKPPLLLLAPLGLIAGGHWRALGWAAATAVSVLLASILLFGFEVWLAWFEALPRFQHLFAGFEPLLRNAVTPYALVLRLGLEASWIPIAAAAIAVPVIVLMFARTDDPLLRSIAMLGGALLITPYAMHYELAALAPAIAAMRLRKLVDAALPAVWGASLLATASLVGLLAVYGWALVRLSRLLRSGYDQRPVQGRVHVPA